MTDLQKAKFNRNAAVIEFLESNKNVFEKDESLIHFYKKLLFDQKKAIDSELEIRKDDNAYNLDKAKLKREVCMMASSLSQTALNAFTEWGEKELIKETKVGYIHFSRYNDFITVERLRNTYRLLHKEVHSLSPDHITNEELASFKIKIKEYADTPGSSSILDRPSTELTGKLRADLKLTDTDIRYIQNIAENYIETNKDFYDNLLAISTLPVMEEESATKVLFLITDNTGLPLQNVAVTIDKSEETLISDSEGRIMYAVVKAGRGIASFVHPEFKEKVSIVKIKAATENIFEITMERL